MSQQWQRQGQLIVWRNGRTRVFRPDTGRTGPANACDGTQRIVKRL